MHVSPEDADEEFGPVRNALTGWLFAFAGCGGLAIVYQFLFGSWRQPFHPGLATVVGLLSLPCLLVAYRAFRHPNSAALRVRASTLRGLAIFCFVAGTGLLVLLWSKGSLGYTWELVVEPWVLGVLAWQVARRRQAQERSAGPTPPQMLAPRPDRLGSGDA